MGMAGPPGGLWVRDAPQPPPIPIPEDYAPGQTRIPIIWGATLSCGIVATALAACRFYVRQRILRSVGKDDWLLLLALAFAWANIAAGLWGTTIGFGRHIYDIIHDGIDPSPLMNLALIGPVCYNFSQFLVQQSILTFYFRLPFSERLQYLTYALMAISALNTTSSTTMTLLFTFLNTKDNSWKSPRILWYVNSSISLCLDLSIWCLPLPTLWRMTNLQTKRKLALIATFSVGLLSCISTIVRLCYIRAATNSKGDEPWNAVFIHVMSVTEAALAICCASMATLRPLLVMWGCLGLSNTPVQGVEGANRKLKKSAYWSSSSGYYKSRSNTGGSRKTSPTVFTGVSDGIYAGPGTFVCTVSGTGWENGGISEGDRGGGSQHPGGTYRDGNDCGWENAGEIELGSMDGHMQEPNPGSHREHDISGAGSSRQPVNPFSGILRTYTIETRRERIDVNGCIKPGRSNTVVDAGNHNHNHGACSRDVADRHSESILSLAASEAGSVGANGSGGDTSGVSTISLSSSTGINDHR